VDYADKVIHSTRGYTDELGQLHEPVEVDSTFEYFGNYTYTVQCSNTTETAYMFVKVPDSPNWVTNNMIYLTENPNLGVLIVGVLSICIIVVLAIAFWREVQ